MHIVFFSSATENTRRFVDKLHMPNTRIPLHGDVPRMNTPYVLITPSYGTGANDVPPRVKRFLRDGENRENLAGVIGTGNMNFGQLYGIAAKKVAERCKVDLLYLLELQGTDEDVRAVRDGLTKMDERTI